MEEHKNIKDFEAFLEKLSCAEVFKVAGDIDQNVYPERYNLAIKIGTNKSMYGKGKPTVVRRVPPSSLDDAPSGIKFIKNIQLSLLIIIIPVVIIAIFGKYYVNNWALAETIVSLSIIYLIYYGIKNKKEWTVLLVLFTSYGNLLIAIPYVLSYKSVIDLSVPKLIVSYLKLLFISYKIVVFSRPDTKKYYKTKDYVII